MTARQSITWEPSENTYVLTIVLGDIKKAVAQEISEVITEAISQDYGDQVGEVLVTTAHVKGNRFSPRSAT